MLREIEEYSASVTHEDVIDVTMIFEREKRKRKKKEMVGFAISYRGKIGDQWHQIIRYDTAHGYLHVQKFWRSPKPIPLAQEGLPLGYLFNKYLDDIKDNWARYRGYVEEKLKVQRQRRRRRR